MHFFLLISFQDHLEKLMFDLKKLKEELMISKEVPKHRLLVYIAELEVMFNIRYINPQGKEGISNAVKKVHDDTKLFSAKVYLNVGWSCSALHLDTLQ